ncbi:MAG TPA: S1 RNA-binding domain-containing protein [Candidatus Polarisedimenticolaceae bacterium]|nr:S1 RNA-binding domain-containing protein [Candidatus Polarisedimenticolaceae bacterium]
MIENQRESELRTAPSDAPPSPPQPTAADDTPEERPGGTNGSSAEATAPSVDPPPVREPAAEKTPPATRPQVASLYRALRSARPVRGTITKVIKGGYEVYLGKTRGFCPHSQIDLQRVDRPEQHVGQTYSFRITQIRRGGQDVVVSRRALLEDRRRDEASAVRATLVEGAVTRGHVAAVADFGAFVDLGAGVRGLVHVSELSHSRVTRVKDVVKVGDEVQARILKLDAATGKISLSIRQAIDDPWADVEQRFAPGRVYRGVVRRMTAFGAFVELAPGVEALAPASEFPPSERPWREQLAVGDQRDWLVLSVQGATRRISVTPPVEGVDLSTLAEIGSGTKLKGKVQRVEDYGVFVWLGPGRVGLMPNALSGVPRGTEMARRFPVGSEIEVEVRELDPDGRRIRLASPRSEPPAVPRPPREPRAKHAKETLPLTPAPATGVSTFGTSLADKLRAALAESDRER